ncbi:MAG TPA: thioredoxin family protein [Pirellulales bacterium]|jgi:hypothetical protein|nr:thioredoxin family protein [Pirellulales bacterium]
MVASRLAGVLAWAVVQAMAACSLAGEADQITFTGRVVRADGSPAAHAIVEREGINQDETFPTETDAEGRFQFSDRFQMGVQLHAHTADGREQATYQMAAPLVRVGSKTRQEIKLRPATLLKVSVVADRQPIADADVAVTGFGFTATAKTDRAGQAEIFYPAGAKLRSVAALYASRGVGGQFFREGSEPKDLYTIELQPTAPHEIRVVDDNDQPIAGLEFGASAASGDFEFIILSPLKHTRLRTDESGIAKAPWVPRDNLRTVSPEIWSDDWKQDETKRDRIQEGFTTQKLKRKHPITGRLIVPEGADPTGILISGDGFGSAYRGDLASARARADGTFTLMVVPDHSYLLGVQDTEWACEPWTGDMRAEGDAKQPQIELALYRATPLTARVSRGPEHAPVPNTYVQLSTERRFKYTNGKGQRGNALGSLRYWLLTDDQGMVHAALGRGEHKVGLSAGEWTEDRKVKIGSTDPVEVDFYRPWSGKRKIAGELVDAGKPFVPSRSASLMAWSDRPPLVPLKHATRFTVDGRFEFDFDAANASILFFDAESKRSGFLEIGPDATSVSLELQPTANFAGTLLTDARQPFVGHEIYLAPQGNLEATIVAQEPDAEGKFQFDAVPVGTPLTMRVHQDAFDFRYYISGNLRFEASEYRENASVQVRDLKQPARLGRPDVPLAEAVTLACRDAALSPMRALVVMEGDGAVRTYDLAARLLDGEETPEILAYRLISVSPQQQENEAAGISQRKWSKPQPGEIVLILLDENGNEVASVRLASKAFDEALAEGRKFLATHRPPQRDTLQLLSAARDEAKASGRRMWVVSGGPRCGPCFRLARWMDDQHSLLEKDYVLVKIMGGLDKNSEAVNPLLPGAEGEGIPFYAILEPDNTVLITSKGPDGNIGMPTEPEDFRHVRRMLEQTAQRLTAAEIAELEKSLTKK